MTDRREKDKVLAEATEVLSSRVVALSDAVQMNNYKMEELKKELNKKPDDAEVRVIAGIASNERKYLFRLGVSIAVLSAFFSGGVSYAVATHSSKQDIQERTNISHSACLKSNQRTLVQAAILEGIAETEPAAQAPVAKSIMNGADKLRALVLDCDKLYPLEKK